MAINFPDSPNGGTTLVVGDITWSYNATSSSWESVGLLNLDPTVNSAASFTSPLGWNSENYQIYAATAQAEALTISADAGAPVNGQKVIFRIKDNGTARALTWTTGSSKAFRAVGVTLPTTTVANKTTYVGCIYNTADSRWDAIAVTTEA